MRDFYPEGLPTDWQLSYYNTQFRCVYLPTELWTSSTDQEVASWLQDTHENFQFVLQAPVDSNRQTKQLACRFKGRAVLDTEVDLRWLDKKPDLRDLAQVMQSALASERAVYLISREGNLTLLRQANELMEVLGV
jgi:uncharacterized protein YecE (DUF72 family)